MKLEQLIAFVLQSMFEVKNNLQLTILVVVVLKVPRNFERNSLPEIARKEHSPAIGIEKLFCSSPGHQSGADERFPKFFIQKLPEPSEKSMKIPATGENLFLSLFRSFSFSEKVDLL